VPEVVEIVEEAWEFYVPEVVTIASVCGVPTL
jgi:hypothetical protein